MKQLITLVFLLVLQGASGQVVLDKPLRFTSTDSTQRQVNGPLLASSEDALIGTAAAQQGAANGAVASGTAMTVQLAMDPPCESYRNGLLIRWQPIAAGAGAVRLNVDGLGNRPLYRGDGLPVGQGELAIGSMAEAVFMDTAFFLQHRARTACPDGFVAVNSSLCMYCSTRGARLCTWDEYLFACTAQQGQYEGLFDSWEWMDDTSDHTHTANQVGRWACRSQRSIGAVDHPNNYGSVRCCYWRK
jgi:hypothetical protein